MDLILEGILQATAVVSVCTLVMFAVLRSGYKGLRPSSVLVIWKILGLRLCVLYPMVYMSGIVTSFYDIFFKEEYADNVILVGDAWNVLPNSVNILEPQYVLAVWLAGAALFLFVHFYGFLKAERMLIRGSSDAGSLHDLVLKYGLEARPEFEKIKVMKCSALKSPALAGILRKTLFVPDKAFEDGDIRLMLRHEIAHYMRKDIALKLFFLFANALHWFNPVIYLMRKKAYEAIELCCDCEVVKNADIEECRSYAELIFYMLQNMNGLESAAFANLSSRAAFLKTRFSVIMDTGKKKGCAGLFSLVFAVMLAGQPFAYVDVYSAGFMDSYISQQHEKNGIVELISLRDLFYAGDDGVIKPVSDEKEIVLKYNDRVWLYKSEDGEEFDIERGDIITLYTSISGNAGLCMIIGDTNEELSYLSEGDGYAIEEDVEAPVILENRIVDVITLY